MLPPSGREPKQNRDTPSSYEEKLAQDFQFKGVKTKVHQLLTEG
jgi:hypothetical protein